MFASCLINLCIGSVNAWSVFSSPMAEYLSGFAPVALTAGSMAIVFTLANGVSPFTMISGGAINDKLGPRWAVFIGGILEGGGKLYTQIKIDEITNLGAVKIRLRSLFAAVEEKKRQGKTV